MTPEGKLLNQTKHYLDLSGFFYYRVSLGPVLCRVGGKIIHAVNSMAGFSDIMIFGNNRIFFLELKIDTPQSDKQKQFELKVTAQGENFWYGICRTIDEVVNSLAMFNQNSKEIFDETYGSNRPSKRRQNQREDGRPERRSQKDAQKTRRKDGPQKRKNEKEEIVSKKET